MHSLGQFWGLVLAGGDGTRLQSLTRLIAGAPIPKQYCRILGDRSLLETTLARIAPLVPRQRTLVVVNRDHLGLATPQLADVPAANVIVQPRNLDTGPGLTLSLLELARRDSTATVAVFPSDHDVRQPAAFRAHIDRMRAVAARVPDKLLLFGARPEDADPGYGYIAPGAPLAPGLADALHVRAFHEKPGESLARRLVRRGGLWNVFVLVCRVDRLLALLRAVRPDDVAALTDVPTAALPSVYDRLAGWNFSRDFLARVSPALAVVPAADVGWSDWGTPEAIERTFAQIGVEPPWQQAAARGAA